jgi:hypothetical protein
VLGTNPYAAVGIIVGAEHQAVRPALPVVDISEVAGVPKFYGSGSYAGRAGGRRADGRRACRAGHTAAGISATRAIDGMRASAKRGYA